MDARFGWEPPGGITKQVQAPLAEAGFMSRRAPKGLLLVWQSYPSGARAAGSGKAVSIAPELVGLGAKREARCA
eukprot:5058708-Lingulodinium_polyedra.AAC.1